MSVPDRQLHMEQPYEQREIREAVPEATFISSVCITGSIITRYFILMWVKERFMEKVQAVAVRREMSYHRIPIMMRQYRH